MDKLKEILDATFGYVFFFIIFIAPILGIILLFLFGEPSKDESYKVDTPLQHILYHHSDTKK